MQVHELDQMVRGWFVGDFSPVAHRTGDVEVGVKTFRAGESEKRHLHKLATEITCVISGLVEMNGGQFGPGKIITVSPGDPCSFRALQDSVLVVVKHPGATADKFEIPEVAE